MADKPGTIADTTAVQPQQDTKLNQILALKGKFMGSNFPELSRDDQQAAVDEGRKLLEDDSLPTITKMQLEVDVNRADQMLADYRRFDEEQAAKATTAQGTAELLHANPTVI